LWVELPVLLVVAVVAAFLVKTFLLQVFFIPSVSMEQTLLVNDRVLVDKLTYDFRDIKRGQVVVFDAAGVLAPDTAVQAASGGNVVERGLRSFAGALGLSQGNETDYIKRVIGLPGDRVACCDAQGRLTVNGVPLDEGAYLFPGDVPSTSQFDVVVPADRLWVMGDHRSASADSRSRIGSPGGGFVPIDRVVGRAFVRTWPVDRIGRLPVPDTFDQPAIEQNRGTPP
jgi:signal peptidase I